MSDALFFHGDAAANRKRKKIFRGCVRGHGRCDGDVCRLPVVTIFVPPLWEKLVGLGGGLEVHKAARVFPVFKDMYHGVRRPLALIAGVVAAGSPCPAVFQRSRRGDFLLGKHTGYLGRAVPGKA